MPETTKLLNSLSTEIVKSKTLFWFIFIPWVLVLEHLPNYKRTVEIFTQGRGDGEYHCLHRPFTQGVQGPGALVCLVSMSVKSLGHISSSLPPRQPLWPIPDSTPSILPMCSLHGVPSLELALIPAVLPGWPTCRAHWGSWSTPSPVPDSQQSHQTRAVYKGNIPTQGHPFKIERVAISSK